MKSIGSLLLTSLLLLSINDAYAQKVLREGYIVKNSGETLTGLVEYSDKQGIPGICRFKRFDIARTVSYSASDIRAFGYLNGNRYESSGTGSSKSFYEVLVTGKIKLYTNGSKYFIEKDNSGLVELKNGAVTIDTPQGKKEFRDNSEMLAFLTEGKVGTIPENFKVSTGIVTLVVNYNRYTGESYYLYKRSYTEKQLTQLAWKSGVSRNRFGVISGINIYSLDIKFNPSMYGITSADYVPAPVDNTGPVFGITYERVLFRRTDRFAARIDLVYNSKSFYCYSERENHAGGTTRDDAWFSFKGIKLPVLAQYSITGGRIVPYFNLGAAYQYFIKSEYLHNAEIENGMHEITTVQDQNMLFKTGELSGVAGLGARIRIRGTANLHLSYMFEYGGGFFQNVNITDSSNRKNDPYVEHSIQSTLLLGITF